MSNGRGKVDLAVHCQRPTCNLPTLDSILSGNAHRTDDRTARRWFLKTATLQLEPCLWRWWFLRQSHSLLFICSRPMHPFATTQNFSHPSWINPPSLPQTPCLSGSIHLHHPHTTLDPVNVIITFNMSKPSQSVLLHQQADWIQSQLHSAVLFLSFDTTVISTVLNKWNWLQQIMNSKHLTDVCTSK